MRAKLPVCTHLTTSPMRKSTTQCRIYMYVQHIFNCITSGRHGVNIRMYRISDWVWYPTISHKSGQFYEQT